MSRISSFLIILLACFSSLKMNAQFITIDDQRTPQQLIENVLVNSSCASASNSTGKGDTFRSGKQSFAYFNRNGSNFPFEEGIVLATSTAETAIGPFVSNLTSNDSDQWLGDSDLDQVLGINSINSTLLEFDFIASANSLSFNYIFASNEYQYDYPCQYSDGFAFLIKEVGSTGPYENLAIIPNTTTPVSSVDIRPEIKPGTRPGGISYTGCPASNESYFNGLNNNTSPINYAGQTEVMTAQTTVVAGKKYHVKLVIADDDFKYLESAIFLEAGSFLTKINFGEDRTISNNNPVCYGENFVLDTKLSTADYTFKWFIKDVPTNTYVQLSGARTSTYTVITPGAYKVEATLNGTTCASIGDIKVEFAPEIITRNTSLLQCDDDTDGITIFDLTKVANIIKNNNSEIINQGYYETLANARAKTSPILNPESYTNRIPNQTVFARIENIYGCFTTPEIALNVSTSVIPDQSPIETCDYDQTLDGLYQFDLQAEVTPQIMTGLPSGLVINYFLTANDALRETNPLPNIFRNTIPNSQTIYARAVNGSDCYDITPVELVVHTFDPPNFEDETLYLCKGDQLTLSVATGFKSYNWSNGATTNSTLINTAGDYSVIVTNANDCQKTKNFKVILSEPALITAEVKDFSGNDNTVKIQYTGVGDYEFSLDGTIFQDDPTFTQVTPGAYNAIARDKNGCGLSNSLLIYVLDYPRFFTPNGDGYNDLWAIKNIDQMPDYTISIFDRYGKLLKQMTQNSVGWNGIFNGQEMPSDDYWFTLLFVNGKNVKGHFSLKR